ncbi:MAG: hypothetical protein U1D55_18980 [Phycisphaerae bacterium]
MPPDCGRQLSRDEWERLRVAALAVQGSDPATVRAVLYDAEQSVLRHVPAAEGGF